MAITSTNHIHGNTISHPGNNICQKITTVVHLLVQLIIKVVIPTATKQMAITSSNTNINQMATTSPSATNKLAITPAKKTQVANSKRQHGNNICQQHQVAKNH